MRSYQQKVMNRPQWLLREGLLASAARQPDKIALVVEGQPYRYGELQDAAMRLAGRLREEGVRPGDRVAIYMDNTWPCIVSIYAVLLAGGVFFVVNPQTKAEKLCYVLEDSEARALLTDWHLAGNFIPAVAGLDAPDFLVVSGENRSASRVEGKRVLEFADVLSGSEPLAEPVPVLPNDLAALIYTSGSTGDPKGVMQTHQSMVFAAWSLIEYLRLSASDRILLVLPLAFDYGLYQLLMAMKLGATLVVERSFTFPARIYERMRQEDVTVFPAVPTIFSMLVSGHRKQALSFPSVRRITNTAAALPEALLGDLKEIFPNALIYKMYGLTECKRVSYLEPELIDEKPDSVGKAIPGTEVFLLKDNGELAAPGEEGVLHVRGPHVMLGYWRKPELTEKMLKPGRLPGERVLCTHDLFRMDEEGFLYFVSRTDDIIKTRGEKVSPIEVENTIMQMDDVREAAVVGVADGTLGSALHAFVVPQGETGLLDRKVRKHCAERLENFMVPQKVHIVAELPRSANGKIDKKRILKEEWWRNEI